MQFPPFIHDLLKKANLTLNGPNPCDPQLLDPRAIPYILKNGSLGVGEAFMYKWWDVEDLKGMILKILEVNKDIASTMKQQWFKSLILYVRFRFFNMQNMQKAKKIVTAHYNLGNDVFEKMLDPYMTYTCAYFKDTDDLNEAQLAKMDLICKKLRLKPGMRLLDIGCGWGAMALYAAQKYGVSVVGLTISVEQAKLAREKCKGYPIEILLQDYRTLDTEKFDGITCIGMFEHVGRKNYNDYFDVVKKHLKDDGLFVLHTIGSLSLVPEPDPWLEKYIFPNTLLPNDIQITQAIAGKLVLEDWQNFGWYYSKTLMEWFKNFDAAWDELKHEYDETFYRMMKFYLQAISALFANRTTQLWQIVLSPHGVSKVYISPR